MEEIYINLKNLNGCFLKDKLEKEFKKDLISVEELFAYTEEIAEQLDDLQEQYDDLKRDLEDNYVSRPMSDYTGSAEDDRY